MKEDVRKQTSVKPIPEGMHTVTPHLVLALARLRRSSSTKKAFGATELSRVPGTDGKLMHASVRIGDSAVMLNEEMPEWGASVRNPSRARR